MKNEQVKVAGNLHKYDFGQADTVFSVGGCSPTILAHLQGQMGHQINILVEEDDEPSGQNDKGENFEGGQMPTAYDPWDNADREISGTILTKPYDYTKKGGDCNL